MIELKTIWSIAGAILLSVGTAGAIIAACSSWLGKVWATRIAEVERARLAKDLEAHRTALQRLAEDQRDAIARKRDIYGRLVASMRVFHGGVRPASHDEKREFLLAFDQAALWASDEVAHALGLFLDIMVQNTNLPGTISNDALKNAYRDCVNAMRKDCGFPDSDFKYRVVTFG